MIRGKIRFMVLGGAAIFFGLALNTSSFAADLEKGMILYQSSCLKCHGEKGDGNGPEAVNYDPRPRNLTSTEISDLMIEKATVEGIPTVSMHVWGNILTNSEVDAVIQYIRTFQKL